MQIECKTMKEMLRKRNMAIKEVAIFCRTVE